MKKLSNKEIDTKADELVIKLTCGVGGKNAVKILHKAWVKIRQQNNNLKAKYRED